MTSCTYNSHKVGSRRQNLLYSNRRHFSPCKSVAEVECFSYKGERRYMHSERLKQFSFLLHSNNTVKVAQNSSCMASSNPKIKMLTPAKLLPVVFFKELVFTKYLFIYLLQQAESFNSGRNAS